MLNQPTEFNSLDDLLYATYSDILTYGASINSKRGKNRELTNYSATLINPKIRTSMSLDRKLVKSKFAEFAWYLSEEDDVNYIKPYIGVYNFEEKDNNKILGAYGSKIFQSNNGQISQYERVIEQITMRPLTKQAYLAISDKQDYKLQIEKHKSPPCTIGLHFYVRDSRLNLTSYMRSNDAYYGLPHDLFCFTMLQELVSCRTNIPIGSYTHSATSMHVYEEHLDRIQSYIAEGKQEPIEMPAIMEYNTETLTLVSEEFNLNINESKFEKLDDYWKDYVLFAHRHSYLGSDAETWQNKFSNKNMRYIALNSLG